MNRLLILCVIVLGSRSETEIGECPDVVPFAELEVEPYLGRWYEERRANFLWEGFEDCVMAIYSDLGDGEIEVHNTANTADGYFADIYGTAEVVEPGTLAVSFPGYGVGTYIVLGTDYVNYSSVYSCEQNGPYRTLDAWLLAREVPLSDESLQEALDLYTDNGVNISLLTPTYQGDDCFYYAP